MSEYLEALSRKVFKAQYPSALLSASCSDLRRALHGLGSCQVVVSPDRRPGPDLSVHFDVRLLENTGDAPRLDIPLALRCVCGALAGVLGPMGLSRQAVMIDIEQPKELTETELRLREKLCRDLGSVVIDALADPKTIEVMLNADGSLWQERLGERMNHIGHMTAPKAEAIMRTIASAVSTTITRANPILEAELPIDGSRFAGQLPPVVSAPTFAIRKKAIAIYSLDQYVEAAILTSRHGDIIRQAVKEHRNILVIGGTGSGKTTLANAIIREIVLCDPHERIVIIEDTAEIQCKAQNYVQYHTSLSVPMTKLLRTTLRMRPDRILVGEVRGPEALDLLMAWNTGHEGGVATVHANNALAGLDRMGMLVSMHRDSPRPLEPLIAAAVHLIIYIAKTPDGRRVREIVEVSGYEAGRYRTNQM
jgi:P-type conjugative transfer ATPase TrbB